MPEDMGKPHYGNGVLAMFTVGVQLEGKYCRRPIPVMGVAHAF